ncbi:MAG: twin-arginine translocase TatA/TatE family subunit [Leptospiraceae bacterium]|nr:twin-arginine translocase TatA/TatE family subunit [Leptospiraceae bacterium]
MLTLAFLGNLGWPEILIIAFLALLLFGGKKLPGLAKDLGTGIREFRKSLFSSEEEEKKQIAEEDDKFETKKQKETKSSRKKS